MSTQIGPNFGVNYGWDLGEDNWKTDNDLSLLKLDTVIFLNVLDYTNTPPGGPAAGDRYLTGAAATGAWNGHNNVVAVYQSGAWVFHTPKNGWLIRIDGGTYDNRIFIYDGGISVNRYLAAVNDLGNPHIVNAGGFGIIVASNASANRTWTFPDKAGTHMTSTGDTMSGALAMADNEIQRPQFKDWAQTRVLLVASVNSVDYSAGNVQDMTLTANVTGLAITNPPGSGIHGEIEFHFTQGGTGLYTVSWAAAVKWPGGVAPIITTGLGKRDIVKLRTLDAGANWYGQVIGQAY